MSDDRADGFGEVLHVLSGKRLPLDGMSSKLLMFMLERPEGCDAVVGPSRFEVRFGSQQPVRNRYGVDTAPGVVSYILHLAAAFDPPATLQAVIGPAAIAAVEGFLPW